jgi:hypothetical protein
MAEAPRGGDLIVAINADVRNSQSIRRQAACKSSIQGEERRFEPPTTQHSQGVVESRGNTAAVLLSCDVSRDVGHVRAGR